MTRLAWALLAGFLAAVSLLGTGIAIGRTQVKQDWALSEQRIKDDAQAREGVLFAYGQNLVLELQKAEQKTTLTAATGLQEIPSVTSTYIAAPGLEPVALPDYHFTVGAVCLWDTRNALSFPGAPVGADGTPDCTQAPHAQELSAITPADVLAAHVDEGAAWAECRETLTDLQAYVRKAQAEAAGAHP